MRKVVIAGDSFKGSISSSEFASVCMSAVNDILPGCETVGVVLADGGEGTVEAMMRYNGAQKRSCQATDPLGRPITADYAVTADGLTAIIEMARVSGLTLLSEPERNPMLTTTYGLGEVIADALAAGCRRLIIGIGGSATNDGGSGMLQALGYRLLDREGYPIGVKGCGAILGNISSIDAGEANPLLAGAEIIVACDVDNPLCGRDGASRVFARQKGADDAMIDALDCGMTNYASALYRFSGRDIQSMPGAGAAGGVGGTICGVLGGRLSSGIETVLNACGFDDIIKDADLVITGEGCIDGQTVGGKAPFGVLKAAQKFGVPVVALCGAVKDYGRLNEAGFTAVMSIQTSALSLEEAMDPTRAASNLRATVIQIIRLLTSARS